MKESDNLLRERAVLRDARRVVVKVGTHSIAKKTGRPDSAALRRVVKGVDLAAGRMLLDAQALAEVAVWEDESAPQDDD